MRTMWLTLLVCILALSALPQTPPSKWQSGTITAVTPHASTPDDDTGNNQYDVSVRVGNTLYTALYTAPTGSYTVRYRAGLTLQVLVDKDTLTFNDLLGRESNIPVLARKVIHDQRTQ